ncbi:Crp/Fnr family transcriptional regulator [Nocardiopsis sp. N85]|uniref:Crp/Fnr family transcriptional regulator n=1 Tax=Nocardiopsis sp. N85 TaxID=3029400 RepID=UPI00237F94CC|nr:Crp/Fnr family transcriptional regulator [Nocardiopsis sp. N85]MDE3720389.1 Crp/Fnr family transcriptional regulator [Nocardiopsis sp. N85]
MSRQGFGGLLKDDQWDALVRSGSVRVHRASEPIMGQGERDDTVHVLQGGDVKISVLLRDGTEALMAMRGPGEVLGEMSVLSGLPRTATVRAARGSCTTYVIAGDRFRTLVRNMVLERLLWEHIVRRQQESESLRTEMAKLTSRERLAETMLRLAGPSGGAGRGPIELHLTQRELGEAVGRSLSWVQGELRRLREDGVVSTDRGSLVIHGAERLRRALSDGDGGVSTESGTHPGRTSLRMHSSG